MQKKFIAQEQSEGIDLEEYYRGEGDSVINGYQARYAELANKLVELAHGEKGSNR